MYTQGIPAEWLGNTPPENTKSFLVYAQMMAGMVVLNSLSMSIGVFATVAKDFETRRTDSFLLTPMPSYQLLTAYFLAAFIVSAVINVLVWLAGAVLIGALTSYWFAGTTLLACAGITVLTSAVSCMFVLLVTALVRSSSAIGVMSSISGTFLGFVCGIYMPYSTLGEGLKMFGSLIPFTHLTIWFKQTVLGNAFGQLGITEPSKIDSLKTEVFSAQNVGFLRFDVPLWVMLILCCVFAVACMFTAVWLFRLRFRRQ
jgi:multidrug/hemolysin transport system permease protein